MKKTLPILALLLCAFFLFHQRLNGQRPAPGKQQVALPSGKLLLEPVPGDPEKTNGFPSAMAVSPDGRYIAIVNNGWGTRESDYSQSIAIVDTKAGSSREMSLKDFPDPRLKQNARQTYFYGVVFSADGHKVYASMGSLSDPDGNSQGDTGNGIAVYSFQNGELAPERFIKIPMGKLPAGKKTHVDERNAPDQLISFPAELAVVPGDNSTGEMLLVANNLSDEAVLLNAQSGEITHHFDLSLYSTVPGSFPYGVVVTKDGSTGYVSLWNASRVAELDLRSGQVRRFISLRLPAEKTQAGSHPTAMLLSPDERKLYVALANTDEVAVVDRDRPASPRFLSTRLPGQQYGGTYPIGLAQSQDGGTLFAAEASADAVAVFDLKSQQNIAIGFVPAEWYPTAVRVVAGDLYVVAGKARGTGANNTLLPPGAVAGRHGGHPYIASLLYGSVARIPLDGLRAHLREYTENVMASNLMRGNIAPIAFRAGGNPIHHVIYVIKENRTYDQILGDLGIGDGDPSLTMYGEEITPNEHKLARQFGVLDNFYDSGEVSGDGHVWSTAAITSDYTEKIWPINYRSKERTYDFEGDVVHGYPMEEGIPDIDEPGTGYLWTNFARHGISYRHYGEFVGTVWCAAPETTQSPMEGTPGEGGVNCPRSVVHKGEALPDYLGQPHGNVSPWPWDVPMLARNVSAKPELRDHFDPRYPDFRLEFPDQLRADEFLNEFSQFVEAKKSGRGEQLPQFILLRLPNDHTSGMKAMKATPSAAIADNDLALGRVVEAVSHSPYWNDTAIFVLEDDAQDGVDHVDAHRSIALAISKYSPRHGASGTQPFVDHTFYTTVNVVRTMEALLGAPPMNNNDARAALMGPLFAGDGKQPAFTAETRNATNGLIYQVNPTKGPGAAASEKMDFSHADAADTQQLNAMLWRDRMGDRTMPKPQHRVFAH